MHIIVSWDISASGERHSELNKKMREGLDGYSWARPLTTFYVVRIETEAARDTIQSRLELVAKTAPEDVNFVVSPAMNGGRYNGFLPKDMWDKINKRSDP